MDEVKSLLGWESQATESSGLLPYSTSTSDESSTNSGEEGGWLYGHFLACSTWLENALSLSYSQRMTGFFITSIAGVFMFGLCVMYLPSMVLGSPQKFAFAYSFGNVFLFLSGMFLIGPVKQFQSMFGKERWLATLIYMFSIVLTFYTIFQSPSALIVGPLLLFQVLALLWYIGSYIGVVKTCMQWTGSSLFRRTAGSLLPL